ncbi:MBOAT family protein [Lentimicrobium sp. L6]|uniref:MBOAT family O-acyltransferase n=1 Tax=Lentimicrobium sp. L6 TaxID=2735916 RepID=UPI001C132538|nr:MBOAT family O-acyltransferase [Lentimicrobium sp. L6]NPD86987.1 MBOAT family protein [Lentimicrobium sp. L6]
MRLNIISVLFPLVFFKYFTDINIEMIQYMDGIGLRWPLPEIKHMLPIGISFYTFMAIGYTIDVYNEEIKAEKNIGILALFISFFPLILSGPIERAKNMIPQFKSLNAIDFNSLSQGLRFILWGYFMKLVVADRIGIYVDTIFINFQQHNGSTIMFASFLYPFQLYTDLGGYSLIAIGVSKVLGISVMHNFNRPFFASSMSEFWRRWHISLISWLTDYLYTPLSFYFRSYKVWGIVIALMITFIISGIWHGAAMTFVVWGLLQGVFLSIEALSNNSKNEIEKKYNLKKRIWYNILGITITFVLFAVSQIFGRSNNLEMAVNILTRIFSTSGALFIGPPSNFIYIIVGLLMVLLKDFADEYYPSKFQLFDNSNKIIRIFSFSLIFITILIIGVFDGGQFIYFQF